MTGADGEGWFRNARLCGNQKDETRVCRIEQACGDAGPVLTGAYDEISFVVSAAGILLAARTARSRAVSNRLAVAFAVPRGGHSSGWRIVAGVGTHLFASAAAAVGLGHQPRVPAGPLKGPVTQEVIQPP